ncbi:MAG: prepilin-type N-terminal cleavage/methylation domain-containing protein [Candidatus Hydrogenedentes bacterium]|nr:prepilin-type N-terminal cleavage/methylation domain-containing protein [Candidatus Hydrogenedentota bacterium]
MSTRRDSRGFSLIEMLTVIALLAVMTTIGVNVFVTITGGWTQARKRSDLDNKAQTVFSTIKQDVEKLLSQRLSGVPLVGEQQSYQVGAAASPFYRISFEDDRMVLPIQDLDPVSGKTTDQNVMYHIDRTGETPALARVLGALGANPPAGATAAQWPGVYSMRVEYFDGENWQPKWDQPALPRSVRVSLMIVDETRIDEQIARRATFGIHVD